MAAVAGQLGKQLVASLIAATATELGEDMAEKMKKALEQPHWQYSSPHPDAHWISCVDGTWLFKDGTVYSAYYHPTKAHRATTVGALGTKRSEAKAGKWAISAQTKAAYGNKATYDTAPFGKDLL